MTKSARIISLALDGQRPPQIAASTGFPISTIYTVISKARRAGVPIPEFMPDREGAVACQPQYELRFQIGADTALNLHAAAAARGTTPGKLAKTLIDTIADDNLWKAILE